MNKICNKCLVELNETNCPPSFLKWGSTICRTCHCLEIKKRIIKNRKLAIANLGGICICCGIDNYNFLSIDHVNGGGIKDRKNFKKWNDYLKHIISLPQDQTTYQCLCYNCNISMGIWGKCPHLFQEVLEEQLSLLPVSDHGIKQTHLPQKERKKRELILRQISRLKIRLEMITAYGGSCVYCSENHPMFLTLDHIHNNGNFETLNGVDFYQMLKRHGYPGGGTQLQLLCHNCNQSKEYMDNRGDIHSEIKLNTPEIYIKQEYSISPEQEEGLWSQARILYVQTSLI